jgi:hypothetical protein
MNVLNLYQLPNWDIFQSPVYRQVGPKDVYGGPLMAGARDKANTPYASRLTIPTAELDSVSYVDADWLSVFRFAATERTEDDIAACLHDGEAAWLIASGSKRLHLTHRTAPHPHAPSHRPRCALFIEWPERPPAGHAVPPVIAERFADSLSATSMFMGYRVYPWPDRIRPA